MQIFRLLRDCRIELPDLTVWEFSHAVDRGCNDVLMIVAHVSGMRNR